MSYYFNKIDKNKNKNILIFNPGNICGLWVYIEKLQGYKIRGFIKCLKFKLNTIYMYTNNLNCIQWVHIKWVTNKIIFYKSGEIIQ